MLITTIDGFHKYVLQLVPDIVTHRVMIFATHPLENQNKFIGRVVRKASIR